MKKTISLMLVCALALLECPVLAQAPAQYPSGTGTIDGKATSSTGVRVSAVTIRARNQTTGMVATTTPAGDGSFMFAGLPYGAYTVECAAPKGGTIGLTSVNLSAPSVSATVICSREAPPPIYKNKIVAALGAAAIAIGAAAIVSGKSDASGSQ
jgi:hypothetical protein